MNILLHLCGVPSISKYCLMCPLVRLWQTSMSPQFEFHSVYSSVVCDVAPSTIPELTLDLLAKQRHGDVPSKSPIGNLYQSLQKNAAKNPWFCGQKSLILRPKILDYAVNYAVIWVRFLRLLCGVPQKMRRSAENAAFCGKCGILRKMRRSAGKLKIRWTFIKMQAHVGQSTSCFSHIMFHLYILGNKMMMSQRH